MGLTRETFIPAGIRRSQHSNWSVAMPSWQQSLGNRELRRKTPDGGFPRTAVQIQHAGREPIVTSPNLVVYYNKDQAYRRGLACRRGDICEYVYLAPRLLAELQESHGIRFRDVERPFDCSQGPCCPEAFLALRSICRLIDSGHSEPMIVEELFLSILPMLLLDSQLNHVTKQTPKHQSPEAQHIAPAWPAGRRGERVYEFAVCR